MGLTTEHFWDCDCEGSFDNYIHPKTLKRCPVCKAKREDCPDSHISEVQAMEESAD